MLLAAPVSTVKLKNIAVSVANPDAHGVGVSVASYPETLHLNVQKALLQKAPSPVPLVVTAVKPTTTPNVATHLRDTSDTLGDKALTQLYAQTILLEARLQYALTVLRIVRAIDQLLANGADDNDACRQLPLLVQTLQSKSQAVVDALHQNNTRARLSDDGDVVGGTTPLQYDALVLERLGTLPQTNPLTDWRGWTDIPPLGAVPRDTQPLPQPMPILDGHALLKLPTSAPITLDELNRRLTLHLRSVEDYNHKRLYALQMLLSGDSAYIREARERQGSCLKQLGAALAQLEKGPFYTQFKKTEERLRDTEQLVQVQQQLQAKVTLPPRSQ